MKGVLGMGMRIVLSDSLSLSLTSSAVGGSEDILRTIVEGTLAYPIERSEPGYSNPDEEDDMNPKQG